MLFEPEISICSIVLHGEFSPVVFHPSWLEANNVEAELEQRKIEVKVIANELAIFTIDDVTYAVEGSEFTLLTSVAPWIRIADIANIIFGELLSHTPIHAFDIRRVIHFNTPSKESRIKLERQLAPIEPWGAYGKQLEESETTSVGGPKSLIMQRRQPTDEVEFETNITVEPSVKLSGDRGVFMYVNHHHQLQHVKGSDGATRAIELLMQRFDSCLSEADEIFEQMMSLV